MNIFTVDGKIDKAKLAKSILIPVAGGMITGLIATKNSKRIYARLKKPDISPPSWVFPVVWTSLYTMMGTANYRVSMKEAPTSKANALYAIQLGLNYLWPFLFFRWKLRGTALADIAALLPAVAGTAYKYYQKDKTAGTFMIPYILWVAFALNLNQKIWKLNRP
ncbi:TspO/MBR family protein [Bacillus marinisedimentorum]|uniref:TspO/MBR family protein n=1 Tax=Bacillus marinisedimentorum TaxID=1821260 RepID=UPI0007DFEC77|nr:TspO/MBR family protein [Bacillus marinisedimentorum]